MTDRELETRAKASGAVDSNGTIVNWDQLRKDYLGLCESCGKEAATHEFSGHQHNIYLVCVNCFDELWRGD